MRRMARSIFGRAHAKERHESWSAYPPPGLNQYVHRVGLVVPVVQANSSVGQLAYRCRSGACSAIPAWGQYHRVAGTPQAAIKDQFIAGHAIACRSSIGLGDPKPDRLPRLDRTELYDHYLTLGIDGILGSQFCRQHLCAAHDGGRKLLAGVENVSGGIGHFTSATDNVDIVIAP